MDVVICNFPPMLKFYLPAAPAILAGACRWLDKSYVFLDFNQQEIDVERWSQQVLAYKPKIVALSVFSYKSREFAQQLADIIKSKNPEIKIVAGGSGIKDSLNGKVLINVDNIIIDDGEYKWAKFLDDTVEYFDNLEAPYLPDYSGYDLQNYTKHNNTVYVPVTGSRGCVRKCTFCEVHQHWDYKYRDPIVVAKEIKNILELIPDASIHFTDSLVNGSLPNFEKLVDLLIKLKSEFPKFQWGGQFIIRKQSTEQYWSRIAQSGGTNLEIGVETGSDRLRYEMDKKFTNSDLDLSLAYMKQFGIKSVFLMFVGYPTETLEDFNQTLDMLTRYQHYVDNTISSVQLGYNFSIHLGTPIYNASKDPTSTIITTVDPLVWYNKENKTLTYEERLRRRLTLQQHAQTLGYQLSYDNHIAVQEAIATRQRYLPIIKLIERQQ